MTTATIETDRLVSQPQREVVYTARREDLRLVKTARYPILSHVTGAKTGQETAGVAVQFRAGLLRLPTSGDVETEFGSKVDAAEILEWMEGHRLNGDRFEGFIRLEQTAPPVTAEELRTLTRLAMSFDREGLEDLVEQEQAGWNREEVLQSARDALEGIAQLEEKAAEEAATAKAKPAKG